MIRTTLKVALAFLLLSGTSVLAQDHDRSFEQGSVWAITTVETKPGMFRAYINDLNNVWRRYLEAQKADGLITSYKMFQIPFPRDGEADLILMIEYPNWEAFDKGNVEYFEKLASRLQGSIDAAMGANVDRESLRTIRSNVVAREISFK